LTEVELSIRTKRTPHQDAKSNATQDNKQHNAALNRRNHKEKHTEKLDMRENHLFKLKEKGKKRCRWVILGQKMT